MSMTTLSLIGFFLAFCAMAYMCMKSYNLYIASIVAASIAILLSGLPLGQTLMKHYAPGFASFMSSYFFRYLWGAIFGILMEKCGAAYSVAEGIVRVCGKKFSLIALPCAVGLMAYSGMAGTVSVFVAIPIFLRVFQECDLPKRFVPGLFYFGTGTFVNCAPGSAQNLNVIATRSVGLDPAAGVYIGLVGPVIMFVLGILYTYWIIGRAKARGEVFFDDGKGMLSAKNEFNGKKPPLLLALIPMIVVILLINIKPAGKPMVSVESAVFFGCVATPLCMYKYTDFKTLIAQLGDGAEKSIMMIGAVCAMSGFGKSIMATPAYNTMVDFALHLNISPLTALFIAMSVICLCTASATSAVSIIGPTLGKTFVERGLNPVAVARVMGVSATVFESMPQNGVIVLLINSLCGETYKAAYPYMVGITVVIPFIATVATIFFANTWPALVF
jgi:H+/gluconate symporter-like permease